MENIRTFAILDQQGDLSIFLVEPSKATEFLLMIGSDEDLVPGKNFWEVTQDRVFEVRGIETPKPKKQKVKSKTKPKKRSKAKK